MRPQQARIQKKDPKTRGELYLPLIQCDPLRARAIGGLLEPEGIRCRIESDDGFHYAYQIDPQRSIGERAELVVKVPAVQLEKAKALLDWEVAQEIENQELDDYLAGGETGLTCPACDSELAPESAVCADCGLELEAGADDQTDIEEQFVCAACGSNCDPEAPACGFCGMRFDN
jgi:hypothetical protein